MHTIVQRAAQIAIRSVFRTAIVGMVVLCAVAGVQRTAWAGGVETFRGVRVEVVGKGRPVLMIPGYNSAGDTWRETCEALRPDRVQCHIVTLPGFAGQPAAGDASREAWLADMGERLLAYVSERKLDRPVALGHSLGGFLALDMALKQPRAFERLVIVDSLPFFSAAFNPHATADSMRPMAEAMRKQTLEQDEATLRANLPMYLKTMTRKEEGLATLTAWGVASDRATGAQAMYELMTRDLRGDVAGIQVPTLVLGAWAAYQPMGGTKESTRGGFKAGYDKLPGVRIEMSEGGYHFLMWDDPQWPQAQVRDFIAAPPAKG